MSTLHQIANIPVELVQWWNSNPKERADFDKRRHELQKLDASEQVATRRAIAADLKKAIADEAQDSEIRDLKAKVEQLKAEEKVWVAKYHTTTPVFGMQIRVVSEKLNSRIQKLRAPQDTLREQLIETAPVWQKVGIENLLGRLDAIDDQVKGIDLAPIDSEKSVYGQALRVLDYRNYVQAVRGTPGSPLEGRQPVTGWITAAKIAAVKLRAEIFETPAQLEAELKKLMQDRPIEQPTWRQV
jgi:DNA repair exonuclease SbcCD ATPase subunit